MAIRALNTLVVANYNTAASASFLAGDALMISTTDGTVSAGFRAATGFTTIAQQLGRFVGFSADDTARTGNTMILADPVGSSYTDSSGVLQANNNGFYVVSKRAIGDFLAENVNGVTNPTAGSSGYEGPRRGVGVFNTPGAQFITDRFAAVASSTVTTDGGYKYHTFTSSGTFTPTQSITADVFVLGAGGAAGGARAGGGGAGGIAYFAGQSLTAINYTCAIGSGGGGTAGFTVGGTGNNSQFGSLTVGSGGGGGSSYGSNVNGNPGGCGGGGGGTNSHTNLGGASNQSSSGTTASYGNRGGNAIFALPGAGGGGTGAQGADLGSSTTGSAGGNGTSAFSSWLAATGYGQLSSSLYYIGGGGGGAGANGGGGSGGLGGGRDGTNASSGSAPNAAQNTGSGGGAILETDVSNTGNGGSGLIIIRYAV